MRVRVLPANEYRRERWKNGLGWTREIASGASAASRSSGFDPAAVDGPGGGPASLRDWRLSIAEIDRDCTFSVFPGVDRVLVLLSGEGMTLAFDDAERAAVAPPYGRVAFAGERSVECALTAGPTRDFNVMWRRDRYGARVLHRPLVGPMLFFGEPGVEWAVHLLCGRAAFKDSPESPALAAGDSALLDGDGRVILDGGGELLLVRFEAA